MNYGCVNVGKQRNGNGVLVDISRGQARTWPIGIANARVSPGCAP